MMYRAALSALLSHWLRHKVQLASLLLGLALATALWSGVQAINAQARDSYDRAAAVLGQDRLARLTAADGVVAQADYVALRRAGWPVSPMIEGRLRLGEDTWRVLGIDPVTAPKGVAPAGMRASAADFAAFIRPPGLAFGAPETVAALGDQPGLPPLRGLEGALPGLLIMDIGIAQALLNMPDQLTALVLPPEVGAGLPPVQTIAPGLVLTAPRAGGDIARLTDSFHLNLTAFGLLSFAVGLFIVHAAIGLGFEQRRPIFRTLRALGLPLAALCLLLAAEVALLALVAGVIGVALGYGVAAALLPDVAATLRGLYGAEVAGALTLSPAWWLGGIGIALVGAAAAAAQSLWRLWHMPILAPAQPRAWARASARARVLQMLVAVVLGIAALALARWGQGIVAGFALLGAMLLGAALALPSLLAALLAGAARLARRPLPQWFWADTRQQLPGLSLALMALMLALAANIGVGTMVASFRLTFTGWLDQRLTSELYIRAETESQAVQLRDWLAQRADAVLPIWSVERPVLGAPVRIYGIADHQAYRDNWPLIAAAPGVWAALADGSGVLVNEQLARRQNLWPGATLALPGKAGLRVVGVYSDYGNPQGQVMIGVDLLTTLFPDVPRLRHAVRIAPDKAAALVREVRAAFDLPADNVTDQAAIKAFSLGVFERTFTVTAALNVLTLGVAGLALLLSLLTLAQMRLPQLAPVWALGLTRAQLARLELLRALMLSALVLVLAVPVGLALAWALLEVVNVAAFGWQLPMHVFPADWLRLGALALLAGGLAALWPAIRLARMAPADLVKVFAHER